MPELPEVETTVRGLQKVLINRTFVDVWTDNKKLIKLKKEYLNIDKLIRKTIRYFTVKNVGFEFTIRLPIN